VLCLLLFASFCSAIVIVCAPNPFFLSLFTLLLVACWLSLICRLQTSGGSIPWLQSSAVLHLGPVPWPRRCSCSVPSLASAVLGSSVSPWCSFSAPHLIAFDLVLRTKPLASPCCSSSAPPRCSPSVHQCSARNLRPRSLPRPQRSSVLRPRYGAPPRLLAFDSVLHTKPSASPRCSSLAPRCFPSVPRCSALNLRPQCSSSVLSSGKFCFVLLFATHSLSCTLLTQLLPLYLIGLIATFLRFFLVQSSLIPCILTLLYSLLPFHSLSFHLITTRYATK
jgi:hypothetical protein